MRLIHDREIIPLFLDLVSKTLESECFVGYQAESSFED